ncbi:MAG: DNA/RNA nuclease SfsA [Sulfolobales archaeon]
MRILRLNDLVRCELVGRLNRFTVQVVVDGKVCPAHLTNTGRLEGYIVRGRSGLCANIGGPKLKYRLIAVEDVKGYAILDTIAQGKVFEQLVTYKLIPWLAKCSLRGRNFRLANEIIDYVLDCGGELRLAELKSSVLRVNNYASYPDCPTARGRRQIKALADHANEFKSYLIFVASVPEVLGFKPNCAGDPKILEVMKYASERGVIFKAISLYLDEEYWITLTNNDLPIELKC